MKVKVEYLGHVLDFVSGKRHEDVEIEKGSSIANLLSILAEEHGEPFRKAIYEPNGKDVKPNYIVTVNGHLLNQLNGIKTKIKEEDQVKILPIVSGG